MKIPWWAWMLAGLAVLWVGSRAGNPDTMAVICGIGGGVAILLLLLSGRHQKGNWGNSAIVSGACAIAAMLMVAYGVSSLGDVRLPQLPRVSAQAATPRTVAQPPVATFAPLPTLQPTAVAHVVAQPATNDTSAILAHAMDKALEREQGQNNAMVNRSSGISEVVVVALMGLFFIAVLILVGRLRNRGTAQPAPDIRIQAPTAPVMLKPGEYFEVNGQIFRVPEQIGPNQQRQIKGKR